jgi:hypothetical protein
LSAVLRQRASERESRLAPPVESQEKIGNGPPPDDEDLSYSVTKLWSAPEIDPGAATGYEVARFVLQDSPHSDYGGGLGPSVEVGEPPTGTTPVPLTDLIADVRSLFVPQEDGQLDGRKVVFGLALLDGTLRERLAADGFLEALGREVDLHANLSGRGKALYLPDAVPTLSDQPSDVDRLGRRAFAQALGARLHDEFTRSGREQGGRADSFMLHLEGPWGSGKSTLLKFLSRDLKEREPSWLVVDFNAWRHQRAGAPWWLLMAALEREALAAGAPVLVRSLLWRLSMAKAWLLAFAGGIALLVALIVFEGSFGGNDVGTLAGTIASVVAVVAGFVGLVRSFNVATAKGAETFVNQTRDPMKKVRDRFHDLVETIDRPIAIFIDDLDRCRAEYVIDLLEGIQTLFRDEPVAFVVTADRHWLYDSYAQVYDKFARDDPGRPLGHLFLEKAFQLTTSLPRLSAEEREAYWERLLFEPSSDGAGEEELRRRIDGEFADTHSEPEVMRRLEEPSGSRLEQRLRREAAVRRLAEPELLRRTEHTLSKFAGLLEPNPRAMKRLVNAYGIERAVQILEGHSREIAYPREKLALWAIVKSRWPLFAEYLSDHPELVEGIDGKTLPPEVEAETDKPYLARLFREPEVARVVQGEGLDGVALDAEALTLFVHGPAVDRPVVHT